MTDFLGQQPLADAAARERAVDPRFSCIVQAPAGSGKTTLLATRYVELLANVTVPEEILAITFTRKAAAEMRERVRRELADPQSARGRAALDNSHERGWQLERYPGRLRIQTIDAFALSLVQQLPVTSELQQNTIAAHPEEYYQQAVARVLRQAHLRANSESPLGLTVIDLLRDFLGNTQQVRNLLVTMLRRREQWLLLLQQQLSEFDSAGLIAAIRSAIELLHEQALGSLMSQLSLPARHKLLSLGQYATDNLEGQTSLRDLSELERWRFIAGQLVLIARSSVTKPEVRARITKTNGFPPNTGGSQKEELLELLAEFREHPRHRGVLEALTAIRDLPRVDAAELDRERIAIIGIVLMSCATELNTLFAERGEVDYNQITIAAITALGTDDAPSDLALSLDYRIHHLLIDEFQDTSLAQHELFTRLIREWTPEDGNSFFAVGDPMQSIYRFRNAEVGLFLDVCSNGIAALPLEHLQLSTNFRSSDAMIGWFNAVFSRVLGHRDDVNLGRISYAEATSPRENSAPHEVRADETDRVPDSVLERLSLSTTRQQQHDQLIEHIRQIAAVDDFSDIAILLRNRAPAGSLVRALEDAGIPWQGRDLDFLGNTPVVSDLVTLAKVLFDPGDRVSLFALLRSPLIGLSLADLSAVHSALQEQTDASSNPTERSRASVFALPRQRLAAHLSESGCARLERLQRIATPMLAQRLEFSPRELVENLWLQLGGPAAYPEQQLKHAQRILDVLEIGHPIHFSAPQLERDIAGLHAEDDGSGVQLLTIHKSKGLQFKHVLLPHLEASTRADDAALLLNRDSRAGLLLACRASGSNPHKDRQNLSLYHWLKLEDAQRARNEVRRLLYVAATRAETSLQLFASLPPGERPRANTLLDAMSDVFESLWADQEPGDDTAPSNDPDLPEPQDDRAFSRLPLELPLPSASALEVALPRRARRSDPQRDLQELDEPELLFAAQRRAAILRGNIAHLALCSLTRQVDGEARKGMLEPDDPAQTLTRVDRLIDQERHLWERAALSLQTSPEDISKWVDDIAAQLKSVANSELGRWCALAAQAESQAELALTLWERSGPVPLVVDRTFVVPNPTDPAHPDKPVRWVIDYKTANPEELSDTSVPTEEPIAGGSWRSQELSRYAGQLSRYARALRTMHPDQNVRTALYFTAFDEFWELLAPGTTESDSAKLELPNGGFARRHEAPPLSTE